MHVRMGDRRAIQGGLNDDYFIYLQQFMDDVTEAVVSKGLEPPMFHVYTQTLLPCPSKTTGLFKEFPQWPVEMDQVRVWVGIARDVFRTMARFYWHLHIQDYIDTRWLMVNRFVLVGCWYDVEWVRKACLRHICWTFFSENWKFLYSKQYASRVFITLLLARWKRLFFVTLGWFKIEPCHTATRPPDCPEKRAGAANCNADRSGIFKVQDMPLFLHVGDNVHECLSCMIQVSPRWVISNQCWGVLLEMAVTWLCFGFCWNHYLPFVQSADGLL